MTTLTSDQIDYVRLMTGDNIVCDGDPVVSDPVLQILFDTAEVNGDVNKLIVAVLDALIAATDVDIELIAGGETRISNARLRKLTDARDYWRGIAYGTSKPLGSLGTGVLALGIDATADSLEAGTWSPFG